jgi:hypothetical protein
VGESDTIQSLHVSHGNPTTLVYPHRNREVKNSWSREGILFIQDILNHGLNGSLVETHASYKPALVCGTVYCMRLGNKLVRAGKASVSRSFFLFFFLR